MLLLSNTKESEWLAQGLCLTPLQERLQVEAITPTWARHERKVDWGESCALPNLWKFQTLPRNEQMTDSSTWYAIKTQKKSFCVRVQGTTAYEHFMHLRVYSCICVSLIRKPNAVEVWMVAKWILQEFKRNSILKYKFLHQWKHSTSISQFDFGDRAAKSGGIQLDFVLHLSKMCSL